jgi:hypothetical protein
MHIGFSQNRDFTTDDILESASQIIPLARTAQEQIQFCRIGLLLVKLVWLQSTAV